MLLHLTQREKKQIIRFPSLMFVRRIPYQSVRRRKIQHWLLLLVRVTALALIIFAFARPFIRQSNLPVGPGHRRARSGRAARHQLQHGLCAIAGSARARRRTTQIGKLSGSDRGSVVLFSSGADIAVRASTRSARRCRPPIAAAKPGAGATRYAPALKVAGGILGRIDAAAARGGADQRLPARRLARRRRDPAAAGHRR